MKKYELLTIFRPNLDIDEVDKLVDKLNDLVTSMKGSVELTDKIGRKKLAYEVKKFRDGFFVNTILSLPEEQVAEFKRQLRLNDSIIRTMFLEVSKKVATV